jgi:type II protein arginine methyltransferase
MDWIEQLPPGLREFVLQLRALPDFPHHLSQFARALRQREHHKTSVELAQRAWSLAPDDPRVRVATEWALRRSVPRWHFPLVHDQRRNAVYEQALQQFVTPNTRVLEIGTGSGILAMLAARAGARHVYTCEVEPLIAAAAKENIVRNGFADRVTVIAKKSTALGVGADLPERADLLVSEIVGVDLVNEGVLPAIEDAKARLLHPDAQILPAEIAMRGVLVGGSRWTERFRMDEICGLDLSAFNRLAPPVVVPAITDQTLDDALSDEVELIRFNFRDHAKYPNGKWIVTLKARTSGVANGIFCWIWLGFSDTVQYDNKPPCQSSWNPRLHVFVRPLHVHAGDALQLAIAHDGTTIAIWPT